MTSVTKLDYFLRFWQQILYQKYPNFCDSFGYFEKHLLK